MTRRASTNFFRYAFAALLTAALAPRAHAQKPELPEGDPARTWKEDDSIDGRWNETDVGPFLASVLKLPGGDVAKGLSIKLGHRDQESVAYDAKTCSFRAAWKGGFLKFDPRRYGIVAAPVVEGTIVSGGAVKAWGDAPVHYRGLFRVERPAVVEKRNGKTYVRSPLQRSLVLCYDVDGVREIRESPKLEDGAGELTVSRTFEVPPHKHAITLHLADERWSETEEYKAEEGKLPGFSFAQKRGQAVVVFTDAADRVVPALLEKSTAVTLLPSEEITRFIVYHLPPADFLFRDLDRRVTAQDLSLLKEPAGPLWPDWLHTGGELGRGEGPYVIDTVKLPFDNPYKALMFTSGFGFLTSGDIAVCTLHGDVWLARFVDGDLSDAKWKRFATGLCQPLGLTVVDDKIYVLGKDQITRLHDTNGDDEADFYECFNNDGATSLGGHDYASCLETDPEGNFYYIRAHEGVCKVSKDGKTHTSIASGFRNPIGLGVGPDGMVTAAPQEGEWTPSSALVAVQQGGYYGFGGPKKTDARPLGFDNPLCWMPRSQDNSSGGQVWVTSDKWGLPRGQMLHLSYGLCTAIVVMHETIDDEHGGKVTQGGTVKLPLFFESGVCRGRFRESDGQLYVCGLMGWQTAAAKDGCLQRVRYTGKPVAVPIGLHVHPNGIELNFSAPLDAAAANDPDNYFIEQWNYQYAASYGSKEYKPSDPKKFGRDEVMINEVRLSADNRTVFLELEEIAPVMQMAITYQLKSAAGAEMKQTIYNTINTVPAK